MCKEMPATRGGLGGSWAEMGVIGQSATRLEQLDHRLVPFFATHESDVRLHLSLESGATPSLSSSSLPPRARSLRPMTAAARKEKEERGREREAKSQGAFIFHHLSPPLRWECRQRTVKGGRRDAGFLSPPGQRMVQFSVSITAQY